MDADAQWILCLCVGIALICLCLNTEIIFHVNKKDKNKQP